MSIVAIWLVLTVFSFPSWLQTSWSLKLPKLPKISTGIKLPPLSKLGNFFKSRYGGISAIEDDGYSITRSASPLARLMNKVRKTEPGILILVRHGETVMNYNKTFTGWIDADLSERGVKEIEHAANLLLEKGYSVDITYTSRLKRAIRSCWILLMGMNQIYKPVYKSWRLNERMYGDLEGKSKPLTALEMGEDNVQTFRAGLKGRPPAMSPDHPYWHGNERKYSDLDPSEIPLTESLEDTMARTIPLWKSRILPNLKAGKNVMLVAHANSLRGIVKHIDNVTEDNVPRVGIPNGIPLVYKFDKNMKPIPQPRAVAPLSGEFLEKRGLLRLALDRESELLARVPGYASFLTSEYPTPANIKVAAPAQKTQFDSVITGLNRLRRSRDLIDLAWNLTAGEGAGEQILDNNIANAEANKPHTGVDQVKTTVECGTAEMREGPKKPQVIVIIRHGKTEYNKLGIFTGWEDAPLIDAGRAEAREAGRMLKMHQIDLDIVYTSWLSRAIETAWLILDELDSLWLPINKTWRLNERMYGALTGMSKSMIAEQHGEEQFRKWRRSYATRPPPTSSFSASYPGNDERYVANTFDIRFSVFESLIRSISHGRIELHRKFPKTESLKDCMSRTIPYFTNVIYPHSIAKGKNVLISSSENAIRGLLMYLCSIPPDRIAEVEIPTGLPLIYNLERKCIQLLDDGSEDPLAMLSKYNFGTSPELLFKPCDSQDSDYCLFDKDGKSYAYDPIIRLNGESDQSTPPRAEKLDVTML